MEIAQKTMRFLTIAMIAFFSATVFASVTDKKLDDQNDGGQVNTQKEVKDYIKHHLKDSHDFALFSYTSDAGVREHVGMALPVIIWTSEGLVTFMSSAFDHNDDGNVIVDKDGLKFAKIHSKIYELEKGASTVSFDEEEHATNAARVLDFSITKSVVGILLASVLLFFWFSRLGRQYKKRKIPIGFGRVLEPLVIYVRDEMARPNIGEKKYKKFTGFLLSVFFFIWLLNMLGLTPLGFNVTGQIAVTFCLALFTTLVYVFSASKDFWAHTLWMPGVPYILRPVLAVIELLGFLVIKPFSLLVRLFANITAGHFVLMSLVALMVVMKDTFGPVASTGMSLVLSLFIFVIELLVAFLQAFIFTMLSSLFIGMAVEEHEHEHH